MNRRRFVATVMTLLAGCASSRREPWPARADAAESRPLSEVEPSGVVRVRAGSGPTRTTIRGDGHTHQVTVSRATIRRVMDGHPMAVHSEPGGADGHRHWVRVELEG